jgi:hypothetical protein
LWSESEHVSRQTLHECVLVAVVEVVEEAAGVVGRAILIVMERLCNCLVERGSRLFGRIGVLNLWRPSLWGDSLVVGAREAVVGSFGGCDCFVGRVVRS